MDLDELMRVAAPLLLVLFFLLRKFAAGRSRQRGRATPGAPRRTTRRAPPLRKEPQFKRDYDPIEPK